MYANSREPSHSLNLSWLFLNLPQIVLDVFAASNKSLLLLAAVNEVTGLPGPWLCHKCLTVEDLEHSCISRCNILVLPDITYLCNQMKSWEVFASSKADFYCQPLSLSIGSPGCARSLPHKNPWFGFCYTLRYMWSDGMSKWFQFPQGLIQFEVLLLETSSG